jgi:hypothetical protein
MGALEHANLEKIVFKINSVPILSANIIGTLNIGTTSRCQYFVVR